MNHDYKYEGMSEEHRSALIPALGHNEQREERAKARAAQGHTPGPWKIVRMDEEFSIRSEAFRQSDMMGDYRGRIVCDIARALGGALGRAHAVPEAEANARLIAAAPDLLAACKALYDDPHGRRAAQLAKAAIAKAEGR